MEYHLFLIDKDKGTILGQAKGNFPMLPNKGELVTFYQGKRQLEGLVEERRFHLGHDRVTIELYLTV